MNRPKFDFELLESRILLSADDTGMASAAPSVDAADAVEDVRLDQAPPAAEEALRYESSAEQTGLFDRVLRLDVSEEVSPAGQEPVSALQPAGPDSGADDAITALVQDAAGDPVRTSPGGVAGAPADDLPVSDQPDQPAISDQLVETLRTAAGPPVLDADVHTNGGSILIVENVSLAQEKTITLDTGPGGGSIVFEGWIDGTAGGGVEHLVLNAGTGNVTIQGDVGPTVALGSLTIISAGRVTVNGNVNVTGSFTILNSIGVIELGMPLVPGGTAGNVCAGTLNIATDSALAFSGTLQTTGGGITLSAPLSGGDITLKGAVTSAGDLTIVSAAEARFNASVSVAGALSQAAGGGATRFDSNVTAADVNLTAGSLTFDGSLQVGAAGNILLSANEIDFNGPAGSVSSAGTDTSVITLRPASPTVPIRVGTAAGINVGVLDLSNADMAALTTNFKETRIGWENPDDPATAGDVNARTVITGEGTDLAAAQAILAPPGANNDLLFTARVAGVSGNDVIVGIYDDDTMPVGAVLAEYDDVAGTLRITLNVTLQQTTAAAVADMVTNHTVNLNGAGYGYQIAGGEPGTALSTTSIYYWDADLSLDYTAGEDFYVELGGTVGQYDAGVDRTFYDGGNGYQLTGGEPGIQTGVFFFDSTAGDGYTYGEDFWQELGGTAGVYDDGVDLKIYDGSEYDPGTAPLTAAGYTAGDYTTGAGTMVTVISAATAGGSDAAAATGVLRLSGPDNDLRFTAGTPGTAGNGTTIALVNHDEDFVQVVPGAGVITIRARLTASPYGAAHTRADIIAAVNGAGVGVTATDVGVVDAGGSGDVEIGEIAFKNCLYVFGTNVLVSGDVTVPESATITARTGSVEVDDGSVSVTGTPGTLAIEALGDITLTNGDLTAPVSISLTARQGAIDQPEGVGLVTAPALVVSAAGGVDLNTDVGSLTMLATHNGGIELTETGDLTISGLATTGSVKGTQADLYYSDLDTSLGYSALDELWKDDGTVPGQYDADDTPVYDGGDGSWDTLPGAAGLQTGVYAWDANGSLDYTAGEDIWHDEAGGKPGICDDGIDTRVYDGGNGWYTGGDIRVLVLNGTLTVSGAGTGVDAGGGGSVTLTAQSAGAEADLLLGQAVISTGGAVALTADGDVRQQSGLAQVSSAGGDVTVSALGGLIAMDAAAGAQSAGGNITYSALTDLSLAALDASSAGGPAGDVTLSAQTGGILDGNGASVNVTAALLTADAATGIELHTAVASVVASTHAAGDIVLAEADAVDLVDVGTADGSILVTAAGQIRATGVDSSATDDGTNAIVLTSTGAGIEAGFVRAGVQNDVTLDAQGTALTQDGDEGADVVADLLIANAVTGITLDTSVAGLDAATSGTGPIVVDETDAVNLLDVRTADGSITISAGGQMTATAVNSSATDSGTNTISLTSTAAGIQAVMINAGVQNDVVLDARGGALSQDGLDDKDDVKADILTASAAAGIDLDTTVAGVVATCTAAGNIVLDEANAVVLADLDTANGRVTVTAVGQITAVDVNSAAADNGANTIQLLSSGAGIQAVLVNAGTQNDVVLTAQGGAITQDGLDDKDDVRADVLTADAAGGIDLDTAVASTDVSTQAAGDVVLDELDAVRLADVDTKDGQVTVTAGGQITATDVNSASTDDGTNTISLTSTGAGIQVGLIDAGTQNDVILVAIGGGVTQDGDANPDVIADVLTVTAAGGISLDVKVSRVNLVTTAAGDIVLAETNAIELVNMATVDGAITVTAGGQITATSVDTSATDDDTNDIRLTSVGAGIGVGWVRAGVLNDVFLDARRAGITQDGDATPDVVADRLTADAAGGIDLDTAVTSLDASAKGAGDIALDELDAIELTDVDTANGSITIWAGGAVVAVDVDSSSIDDDTNDITIGSLGAGIDVGLVRAGLSTLNDVTLDARGGPISQDGDAAVDVIADLLTVDAAGSIDLDTMVVRIDASTGARGDVLLDEADAINLLNVDTADGGVAVTAGGQITATDVDTHATDDGTNGVILISTGAGIKAVLINAGTSDVKLDARGGPITQDGGTNDYDDVVAGLLTADALGGIDLDVTVASVDASALAAGAIVLDEASAIDLTDVDTMSGPITVGAGGQITATDVDSSATDNDAHDISLTSTGAGIQAVRIKAGSLNDVTLNAAGGAISQDGIDDKDDVVADVLTADSAGGIDLDTTVASVDASCNGPGALLLDEADAVLLTELDTAGGPITVTAGGLITAADVSTAASDNDSNDIRLTSTGAGIEVRLVLAGALNDVTLDARGGAITQDGDSAADVVCDVLTADAAGGVNLDTTVASVDVSTSATGDVVLDESDVLVLTDVDTANGAVTVTAGGLIIAVDVSTVAVDDGTNGIALTSLSGGIEVMLLLAGTQNDVTLDARGGPIGQDGDLFPDVLADRLTADAAGSVDLDTLVVRADISTTAQGDILLFEVDGIELTDLDTADGAILVTAGGQIVALDVDSSATDDDTNGIWLESVTEGITVAWLRAGVVNDVVLDARGGAITQDGDAAVDVTADLLMADAITGIDLDSAVSQLDATVSGTGALVVDETDAIQLLRVDTANGPLTVRANGTMVAADVQSLSGNNDANDILLLTTSGDLLLGLVSAGTNGEADVSVEAQAGAVAEIGAGDTSVDVEGDAVVLTAFGPIGGLGELDIETRARSLDLSSADHGAIVVTETDAVVLTDVDTANGPIVIVAGGELTAMDVASLSDAEANSILLSAASGNLLLGRVDAGTAEGDVMATANAGQILEAGPEDSALDLIADQVTLRAQGSIGGAGAAAIETSVNGIVAFSSLSGDIVIWEANAVELMDLDTTDGSITVTAGGTITATDVQCLTDAAGKDVVLWATMGDVRLGLVQVGPTYGNVLLTASAGAIVETGAGDAAVDVVAKGLVAGCRDGVGGDGELDIETRVDTLNVMVVGSGDVTVTETDTLEITNVETADGSVSITAGNTVTALNMESLTDSDDNDITLVALSGDILLGFVSAGETAGDVWVSAPGGGVNETGASGDPGVDVEADTFVIAVREEIGGPDEFDLETRIRVLVASSDTRGDFVITEADAITLGDVATADGTITVTAGEIYVGSVVAGGGALDVFLTSVVGAIDEADPEDGGVDLVANRAVLSAVTGIGINRPIEMSVTALEAAVTGQGGLALNATGALVLDGVTTADGRITIVAGGPISAADVRSLTDSDANDVTLRATLGDVLIGLIDAGRNLGDVALQADAGAIHEMLAGDAAVDIVADRIVFAARDEIGGLGEMDIETDANTLAGGSLTGDVVLTEDGAVTLMGLETADGSITVLAGGTITAADVRSLTDADDNDVLLRATAGDILVGFVSAGTMAGDVLLTADAGVINEMSPEDPAADIVADEAVLNAAGEIGGTCAVETSVRVLTAHALASGAVVLNGTGPVELRDVDTLNGAIRITAAGALTATDVQSLTDSDANDIRLESTAGDVLVGWISAGNLYGDVLLTASGGGAINEVSAEDAGVDVVADEGVFNAKGEIGGTRPFETALRAVTAHTSGPGRIVLNETDALELTDVDTADGAIVITAGGTLTAWDVRSLIDSDANDIVLTTTSGDILVGFLDAGTTAGNATLTAQSGHINETAPEDAAVDLRAGNAVLWANGAIGGARGLETDVAALTATANAAGDIVVYESNAVVLTQLATVNGVISVLAPGKTGFWEAGDNYAGTIAVSGDFDGDGTADFGVCDPANGYWFFYRGSGGYLLREFGYGGVPAPADYDGDGITDMALYDAATGLWRLQKSTAGFETVSFGFAGTVPVPADYDGDGRADIGVYHEAAGDWYLRRTSAGFAARHLGAVGMVAVPGDYDGDGRADMAVYQSSSGDWQIQGSTAGLIRTQFGWSETTPAPADYDGDGRTDLAVFHRATGDWFLLRSTAGFLQTRLGAGFAETLPDDYDGDGRADPGAYAPGSGQGAAERSTAGSWQVQFGYAGSVAVTGDFDGDGVPDPGLYHVPSGTWRIRQSTAGWLVMQFGWSEARAVPGDYDGDGRTDVAVYHQAAGTWYVRGSTSGFRSTTFGWSEAVAAPGDYDGDGTTDLAVYHAQSGDWYLLRSAAGFARRNFGYADTRPVPADYDGDGTTDLAVYHALTGKWHVMRSTAGYREVSFGWAETVPVPGDYDGDGRADFSVYHAAGGTWYLQGSTAGFQAVTFGSVGAQAVGWAYDYDADGRMDMVLYHPMAAHWYVRRSTLGILLVQLGPGGPVPLGVIASY